MTRLDAATSNASKLAKKMAKEAVKERTKPKTWKGKKIIPLLEWRKKFNIFTLEWKNYFPEEFSDDLLFPPNGEESEFTKHEDEWWAEFIEYMEVARPASYGKHKCRHCILNTNMLPLTTTIRDAFMKTYVASDDKSFEFPCNVVNFFKCPYGAKYALPLNVHGYMGKVLDDVLKYNIRSTEHKRSTYRVDFIIDKIFHPAGFDGFDSSPCKISDVLNKLKFPRVENTSNVDLYEIITTRDKLKSVLEEYRDAPSIVAEKSLYYQPYVDYIKHNMDRMLDFFDSIKDEITLEDRDTNGQTFQENKDMLSKNKEKDGRMSYGSPGYPRAPPILSSPCFSCGEIARINCKNCGAWMCLQHWKDHGVQAHNYANPPN